MKIPLSAIPLLQIIDELSQLVERERLRPAALCFVLPDCHNRSAPIFTRGCCEAGFRRRGALTRPTRQFNLRIYNFLPHTTTATLMVGITMTTTLLSKSVDARR